MPDDLQQPDYDLIPVDHTPEFTDGPIAKPGQTILPPTISQDIAAMPGKVANVAGDVTGVNDAISALKGNMTPEEAQNFALMSAAGLVAPELRGARAAMNAAEKVAPEAAGRLTQAFSDIRPARENLADLVDANFLHGRVVGDRTVPINTVQGGVSASAPEQTKVSNLAAAINSPEGYIERPVVDDVGNVIEGAHRVEALRQLGATKVPVTVIKDLARGYDTDAMATAIRNAGMKNSDQVNQMVRRALDSIHAEGDPKAAAENTSIGGVWEKPYQAALAAALPPQGIRAYHGSPYDFDKFDISKIGTGEGAQAYGHGLYFAENPGTAESYKHATSDLRDWPVIGGNPDWRVPSWVGKTANASPAGLDEMISNFTGRVEQARAENHWNAGGLQDIVDALRAVKSGKAELQKPGKMYEVNINADPEHFLDWDKPLSEQSEHVKQAIAKVDSSLPVNPPSITQIKDPTIRNVIRAALQQNEGQARDLELMIDNDGRLYKTVTDHAKRNGVDLEAKDMRASDYVYQQAKPFIDALAASQNTTGEMVHRVLGSKGADVMAQGPAAARLHEAGIPGIKYLDQGSRGAGEGTKNYVVFNDRLVDIIKKYGLAGLVAGGAAHYQTTPVDYDPFDTKGMASGGSICGDDNHPESQSNTDWLVARQTADVSPSDSIGPRGVHHADAEPNDKATDRADGGPVPEDQQATAALYFKGIGALGTDPNYDYVAARSAGVKPDERGHLPDTYKLPTHITFSDESLYNGQNGNQGGSWQPIDDRPDDDPHKRWMFTPGPTNLQYHSPEELQDYFQRNEPDSFLNILQGFPGYARGGRVLPQGLTAEFTGIPLNKWGVYDKNGELLATGKTKDAAIANLTPQRAAGGRIEAKNINHSPTEAQKRANNYAHDKIHVLGMKISIENAAGSYRKGKDKNGKEWRVKMPCAYGYLLGTEARDGDHVDCFIGPHRKSPHVWVIDQINHETGKYDEPKVCLCFASERQAINFYRKAFSDGKGKERIGKITGMTVPQFRHWLEHGDTTKPFKHPEHPKSPDRVQHILGAA